MCSFEMYFLSLVEYTVFIRFGLAEAFSTLCPQASTFSIIPPFKHLADMLIGTSSVSSIKPLYYKINF